MAEGILVLFSTVAVCMDLNCEKIDNRWIAIGWLLGFSYQLIQQGLKGIGIFFLGAAVPIVILYVLFWFRMIGAGDVKMLSVLGGFMGPKTILICMGIAFICGAVISLAVMILCGNLMSRLRYFAGYLIQLTTEKRVVPYMRKGRYMENIHFSVPILMGVLLFVGGFY